MELNWKQGALIVLVAFVLVGIGMYAGLFLAAPPETTDRDVLFQVSTINALLQGSYDGVYNFSMLETKGDFGIATLDRLDGEMIGFDGKFYQIKADGTVREVPPDETTPFASITWFEPDREVMIARADNFSDFSRQVEAAIPSPNLFYALRVDGTFPVMTTRAIPRQEKPYPRLVDASAEQSVFPLNNSSGTVAGFWTPDVVEGLNIPGMHLHYLTDDRSAGGHILDFSVENATVLIDLTPRFALWLPEGDQYAALDLGADLSGELADVEQGNPTATPGSG